MRKKPSILLVDEHEDFRLLAALHLERQGYRVTTATNVTQALAVLLEQRVEAIVTDVDLAGGGSRVLLWASRAWRPGLPVLMTVNGRRPADGPATQADAVFEKPCDFDALARHLASLTR